MSSTLRAEGEKLFLEHLKVIEQVIRFVSTKASLLDAEAEDFSSYAKIRLIEDDYATLRKFKGHCSIATYLSIVISRMLMDYRIQLWGKWHSSAEAKRLGQVAVTLETILHRDGRSIEEALPYCQRLDASVTLPRLQDLAARLPQRRHKVRTVGIDVVAPHELSVSSDSVIENTIESDRAVLSRRASDIVRETMAAFSREDRLLLRLQFGAEMSIAQAARAMGTDQKPLYRRSRRCLKVLRRRLEESGITGTVAEEILSGSFSDLDFGLYEESHPACPSLSVGPLGEKAEDLC